MELQRQVAALEESGYRLLVVSPDPVEVLARFGQEHGITYRLLADENSEVIKQVGILNTLIAPDEASYGIPFPGLYVTNAVGTITHKVFHQRYQERETADALLHGVLGLALDMSSNPRSTVGGGVSAVFGGAGLAFGQRAELYVQIAVGSDAHIYGPEVPRGYVPTTVEVMAPEGIVVGAPRYPSTTPFRVAGLAEEFQVFDTNPQVVEIVVPLLSQLTQTEGSPTSLSLEIRVQYQACTQSECFLPQRQLLTLDVPVIPLNRAPRPR